jgi:hypothetical protein
VAVGAPPGGAEGEGAAGAVADGLSTALMVLSAEEAAGLCARFPELEAWLVPGPAGGDGAPPLVHLGPPGAG